MYPLQCPRSGIGALGAGQRRSTSSPTPTCTPDLDWGRGRFGALAGCRVRRGQCSGERGKTLAATPEAKRRFGCALLSGLTSQKFVLEGLSLQ